MASTILELAASMVRIFEQMRLRCLLIAAAAALVCAETARADLLLDGTIVVWPARASAHAGAR